jgi:hypothetical protein
MKVSDPDYQMRRRVAGAAQSAGESVYSTGIISRRSNAIRATFDDPASTPIPSLTRFSSGIAGPTGTLIESRTPCP